MRWPSSISLRPACETLAVSATFFISVFDLTEPLRLDLRLESCSLVMLLESSEEEELPELEDPAWLWLMGAGGLLSLAYTSFIEAGLLS